MKHKQNRTLSENGIEETVTIPLYQISDFMKSAL